MFRKSGFEIVSSGEHMGVTFLGNAYGLEIKFNYLNVELIFPFSNLNHVPDTWCFAYYCKYIYTYEDKLPE